MLKFLIGKPFDSGKRWPHRAPPQVPGLRLNTLLVANGARKWRNGEKFKVFKDGARFYSDGPITYCDADWRICGSGIVLSQHLLSSGTIVEFQVIYRYNWILRAVLTAVNSEAQRRAQAALPDLLE